MKDMEQIYKKYMPQVYKYLFSLCHDTQLTEELTQETFFQAVKSIETAVILMIAAAILLPRTYGEVKYEDVTLNYGTREATAYLQITVKPGRGIVFSGENTKDGIYLEVLSSHWVLNSEKGTIGWEDELGSEDDPCKWTLEFKDKILVFENGELVQEKEK